MDNWKENNIDVGASYLERWNWKANLDKVKFILEANKSVVINRMTEALLIVKTWDDANKKDKVAGHSDKQEGSYTFSHVNSPLFPTIDLGKTDNTKKSFIDAIYIKMFNSGTDRSTLYYWIKQDNDPKTGEKKKPEWIINDQGCFKGNCWNYVNNVCVKN